MRPLLVAVLLVLSLWTASCTSVVDGAAVRSDGQLPRTGTDFAREDLDQVLLDDGELNGVLHSARIEVTDEVEEMTDGSFNVSHPECVGAFYSAEESVYEDTGYEAVLTWLATEPGDDYEHWVEETAVVMPSSEAAEQFVDDASRQWAGCAGLTVSISDGEAWYDWELAEAARTGGIVSQKSTAVDSVDWQCEHTIAAISNLVVEASVCAERVDGEATALITEMLAKAAGR